MIAGRFGGIANRHHVSQIAGGGSGADEQAISPNPAGRSRVWACGSKSFEALNAVTQFQRGTWPPSMTLPKGLRNDNSPETV